MKRICACLLALLALTVGMALAEDMAVYQSEHGYTLALPDASWFRLDGDTYQQYSSMHAEFAAQGVEDADEAAAYARKGLECYFSPDAPGAVFVVQRQKVTISDSDLELTLSGLRQLYEALMGAEGYTDGAFTFGETLYEGCAYTLEGVYTTQLYVRPHDGLSYILTSKGIDEETLEAMLAASTFA